MTPMLRPCVVAGLVALGQAAPSEPARPESPQFRSSITGVALHVLVQQGGRTVTGLGAEDFVLNDTNVRQQIRAVDANAVPLEVIVVAEQTQATEFLRRGYRVEIADVSRMLREDDHLRLFSAGEEIREVTPESVPTRSTASALNDALAGVLVRRKDAARLRVVISMSSRGDAAGAVADEALLELAQRSDAQLHVLVTEPTLIGTRSVARLLVGPMAAANWDDPSRSRLRQISHLNGLERQWQALWDDRRRTLVRIAEATGGGEVRRSAFSDSIADPVKRVLDHVRSGYVLYYVPTGVPERGWHPIEVQVARPGRYDVHARPGYLR